MDKLFVFGSILTDNFKKSSDIDFLVDFTSVDLYDYVDNYFDLKTSLEKLLKRQIDLLEDKAVRNPSTPLNKLFTDNDIKTWLYDTLQSINEIDGYYSNKPRIIEEYVSDIKTKRAIELNLKIIGKAANRKLS